MLTFSEIQNTKKLLTAFWSPNVERCGTINPDIVEQTNLAEDPQNFFQLAMEDLSPEVVLASWHSHPVTSANLSIEDYRFFQSWPKLFHFIIGVDEVRCYQVLDGIVYCVEEKEDYTPRIS
jgi:proteasome lid subunit RPN8/RPN11